jgi:hypothetical protein
MANVSVCLSGLTCESDIFLFLFFQYFALMLLQYVWRMILLRYLTFSSTDRSSHAVCKTNSPFMITEILN